MTRRNIAIDLGTVNTLACVEGLGLVLREPTLAAVRLSGKGEVAAVGEEARQLLMKDPESYAGIALLRDGVIADRKATEILLKYFLRKSLRGRSFLSPAPNVVVCVPGGVTEVEREAMQETVFRAGAWKCMIVQEPVAAAIGAGLPVNEPKGSMIVDIGGGTCEIAVVSLGGIVAGQSVRIGGNKLDAAIQDYVRSSQGLLISEKQAEDIKINLGSASEPRYNNTMEIAGLRIGDHMPGKGEISTFEVYAALNAPLRELADAVRKTMEKVPPELAADILENGIMLSGGSSQLSGLDVLLYRATGVETILCDHPLEAVVLGAEKIAEGIGRSSGEHNFRREDIYRV